MSKKTLEQKITCVKLSAFIFAIGYFLLGVILKRTGPKFDPDKAYDLITTSLTLTAYFLAPVAAFVLFSDWREQHKALKLEIDSENIIKEIYVAHNQLLTLFNAVCIGEKKDQKIGLNVFQLKNELILKSRSIIHDSQRLKKLCGDDINFIFSAIGIATLLNEGAVQLHDLH